MEIFAVLYGLSVVENSTEKKARYRSFILQHGCSKKVIKVSPNHIPTLETLNTYTNSCNPREIKHRRALLKNLVTALIEHESITTTHAKAKETQRLADRLISLTKKNDIATATSLAQADVFKHGQILPKLFGELKDRYANRVGGFTRVLRLEPRIGDNAPQSIVELVDGGREMKFWLTARIVARLEQQGLEVDDLTKFNVEQLTKLRANGPEEFRTLVERMKLEFYQNVESFRDNLPSENLKAPTEPQLKKNIRFVQRPAKAEESA
ncbi:hypothetical protein WICPIJ_002298 [Wickerhamomyces pijperi]|uniref:54S ribosomal protein L8 C-terminal domain-containing protein n=1 Tax=Wickerhamomyces pijperi TaxID=599730 RepID=A0A9P8TP33_WICPI|nr:hypothetical protein WICPIJ_002298 [Wickerhamomyces pijperi]